MGNANWGPLLVIIGIILVGIGFLRTFFPNLPQLGRLPGDIVYEGKNTKVFIPITSGIVISVVISLALWLYQRVAGPAQ